MGVLDGAGVLVVNVRKASRGSGVAVSVGDGVCVAVAVAVGVIELVGVAVGGLSGLIVFNAPQPSRAGRSSIQLRNRAILLKREGKQ